MNKNLKRTYPLYYSYPAFFIYGIFFLLPTFASFFMAFTDWNAMKKDINFIGLANFKYLFTDSYFKIALKNTLLYGIFTTVLKVVSGLLLALALNRKSRTTACLRTVFFMPYVLSYVIVGIIFHALFRYNGVINEFLQTINCPEQVRDWLGNAKTAFACAIGMDVWKGSGFFMMIFIAGLQGISSEYYEAAAIDGASRIQRFWYITLPLLVASLTINITIAMIGGFRVFDQIYVLTKGGPGNATNVINTIIFQAQGAGMYGRGTAMGLILTVFILILSCLITNTLGKKEVDQL